MYLPKSKYQLKESTGEFIYLDTKNGLLEPEIHVGPYIELTDGTTIAGSSIKDAFRVIVPLNEEDIIDSKNQVVYRGIFNQLKEDNFEFHSEVKKIVPRKPYPTSKDYERGKFRRYFVKRKNSKTIYFEIDKETFKKINERSPEYDYYLYSAGTILWDLTDNSSRSNATIIQLKKDIFPYLNILFPNLQEYYKPTDYKPEELDRTKPNKKELAKSKQQSEVNRTLKNKEKRRKQRLQKKKLKRTSPSISPISGISNIRPSGGGGGGY